MVLHGIALYDLVSYIIYFACFCVFRFVARAVSRKTPILLIVCNQIRRSYSDEADDEAGGRERQGLKVNFAEQLHKES